MTKTTKHYKTRHLNKTKRHRSLKKCLAECPIGLKPFEDEFSKELAKDEKNLHNIETVKKVEFAKELISKFSPASIKPNNDFYDYVNYSWLKNVSLKKQQEYIIQIDDFRLAQDKVYTQLNEIILNYIKTHDNKLSKNLKNYYNSVIAMNPKSYSRHLAKEAVKLIDKYIADDNVWALLAYFNSSEMLAPNVPFVWSLNPDDKEPTIFRCYIEPVQFLFLDLSVYYDDGTNVKYKEHYRKEANKATNKMFNILLGKNDFRGQDTVDVQMEMFNSLGCVGVTRKAEKIYNKVYANEALRKYNFDWCEFSKQLGFKKTPEFFITSSLNYLKCGTQLLLDNWKTPKWRTYWIFLLFRRLIRITKDWEKIIYDFHGRMERGQSHLIVSPAVSSTLYMTIPFNTFLTNEYVSKYEDPQYMKYTEILSNDLKFVFRRILMRNKWLQPSTKKYALKKLDHFKFIYGKPENLREDPDLNYGTILYDNMIKISDWRHKQFIDLEGKNVIDIPMVDWNTYPVKMVGTQAYIVNASYTPSKNAIYINLGYIQKPFVDLDERGIAYNLAHIGFTIAHEMSHGFDDFGSQYGFDGKLNDWWTEKDKKKYKAIQQDVITQYEEFAARDGIKFDASIGIGEDLADISGLAICSEYLRDHQDKNKDIIPIRSLCYEQYFTYFAFQQRQFVSKKALSAQLKTNPHPLDKYRTNVPLSRSSIFRTLYDVKRGDGMWWHNTDTIW